MRKWGIVLVVLAALDVLTTYLALQGGAVEANPAFSGMGIGTASLLKMSVCSLIALISVRQKLKFILIFGIGANTAVVASNLMAIWTLKAL
jgi:hypothetical protein